jgi:hypothetical protein
LGCALPDGNKNGKKTGNFLLYVAYLCRPPPLACDQHHFGMVSSYKKSSHFGLDEKIKTCGDQILELFLSPRFIHANHTKIKEINTNKASVDED